MKTLKEYKQEVEDLGIGITSSKSARSRDRKLFVPKKVFKLFGYTNATQLYDLLRGFGYIENDYLLPTTKALQSGHLMLEVKGNSRTQGFWSLPDLQCLITVEGLKEMGCDTSDLKSIGVKVKGTKKVDKIDNPERNKDHLTPTQAGKVFGIRAKDFNDVLLNYGLITTDENQHKIPTQQGIDFGLILEEKAIQFDDGSQKLIRQLLIPYYVLPSIEELMTDLLIEKTT